MSWRIFAVLALFLGIGCWQYLYPPTVRQRQTRLALERFSEAVASHDRGRISGVLSELMNEDAKLTLEVQWLAFSERGRQPIVQDFTKADFVRFVDNILYTMDDYGYTPELEQFRYAKDGATVVFTSGEWADGKSHYGGIAVSMRFSSNTRCEGEVVFAGEEVVQLKQARCTQQLRALPKPEEAHKLQQNPAAMQQYLMR